MTEIEDRLRQDLPALADVLMEDEITRPDEAESTMADGSGVMVARSPGAQPGPRRRRWPAVAAAAVVAAVAGVAALVITTSDDTEVTTTAIPVAQPDTTPQDREHIQRDPALPDGPPLEEVPPDVGAAAEDRVLEGTFSAISAHGFHTCAIAASGNIVCWGWTGAGQLDAPDGSYQAITGGGWHNCALAVDGTITCWGNDYLVPIGAIMAGRAEWTSGYFQAALYRQLLQELGYRVSDPAELELGPSNAYTAMAQGDMDYWPNSWYPTHSKWLAQQLPDGSTVADHVTAVGEQMISGGAQGYLVTKSFADTYGAYTLDELDDDAEALAAYDATDQVPGNGKAEIYGCAQNWTCADVIDNQIAFSGWDNIVQVRRDNYDAHFATVVEKVNDAVPVVVYTWAPSRYITQLRPGDNVYWMGVDDILDDSNPTGVQQGHEHDQRGPDGTGGFAAFGPDQCPSAAGRPDGRCPIGWLADNILVTANTEFLQANPVARALFEAVELTVLEVSLAHETASIDGIDPDELAARWIADNRDRVDAWLAAARAAA